MRSGCYVGNMCLNHIIFADDICCFSPSLNGLQDLLDTCCDFAAKNNIVFNARKSTGVYFQSRDFRLSCSPKAYLGESNIQFKKETKYLGVCLNDHLTDDDDINRQTRFLYGISNKLASCFKKCSAKVKNILFQSHCMSFYACQLWCKFRMSSLNRIRVAFNDAYRLIHQIPRWISVRHDMVFEGITTFDAILRKSMFAFIHRCFNSQNALIVSLMNSDVFFRSHYLSHYSQSLYQTDVSADIVNSQQFL